MSRGRPSPAERVRAHLRRLPGGEAAAAAMPAGYQRLGRVLVLRLPASLRAFYPAIGAAWQAELGVTTVAVRSGPVSGELREPTLEVVAGGGTETEVVEHGVRWRFDAARVMFAAGNKAERLRAGRLVRPGERVIDLFAGIGYFSIPAALPTRAAHVLAVEKNPIAFRYLRENARANGVEPRIEAVLGDNRQVELPPRSADRVFLGYLPSGLPWLARAVGLLRSEGGWVHLHAVADARSGRDTLVREAVRGVEEAGGEVRLPPAIRTVKPYGPGRSHFVVDLRAVPDRRRAP
jgi:tRNA wybutosine-synthesizing protein 2